MRFEDLKKLGKHADSLPVSAGDPCYSARYRAAIAHSRGDHNLEWDSRLVDCSAGAGSSTVKQLPEPASLVNLIEQ